MTAARESASPALARLPVAELAPPPLGRPVPLVSVKVSELVENIPSPARGVRSSAGLEGDPAWAEPAWAEPAPFVPAAVSQRAARERRLREQGARNSAGLEDYLA